MDFVPDMHMRILLVINSDQTAWLAKTPAVDAWGNRSIRQTFGRSREKKITREFWSGSTTVGVRMMRSTLITQLYAQNWKGCTKVPTHFMWNSLDASEVLEREVVLDNDWGKNWVEPRWVGCTVF